MDLEIRPEPEPTEREALAAALARVLFEPSDPWSGWWREGVRENVLDGSTEGPGETS